MTIEIEGDKILRRKLEAMTDAVAEDALETAGRAGAQVVEEMAAQLAPRRTGRLAESMTVEVKKKSRAGVEIGVGPSVFYGRFVELGTQDAAAQPYLRPAFDAAKGTAESIARKVLAAKVLKAGKLGF